MKYTVVLLRPDYIEAEGTTYGQDIYVAHVSGNTFNEAIVAAQEEVFEADKRDGYKPDSPDDYALCILFAGHIKPLLFGWQL